MCLSDTQYPSRHRAKPPPPRGYPWTSHHTKDPCHRKRHASHHPGNCQSRKPCRLPYSHTKDPRHPSLRKPFPKTVRLPYRCLSPSPIRSQCRKRKSRPEEKKGRYALRLLRLRRSRLSYHMSLRRSEDRPPSVPLDRGSRSDPLHRQSAHSPL